MTFDAWVLFCTTATVLCLTPGPAVMFVVSMTLVHGTAVGIAASVGIVAANIAYFVVSATSLGAILASSSTVFVAVTWLGGAYLVWMGASMLLFPTPPAAAVLDPPPRSSLGRSVARGFVTQVVNPHTLVFFTALLPQFIDPARPVTTQVLVLGVSTVVIEAATMMLYVAACHGARSWLGAPRFAVGLQRIGGALLIGAGARLAAIRHAAG